MMIIKVLLPETQKLSGPIGRKLGVIGLTKLIVSPVFLAEPYVGRIADLVLSVVKVLELPEEAVAEDELVDDSANSEGYQVAFAQVRLAFSFVLFLNSVPAVGLRSQRRAGSREQHRRHPPLLWPAAGRAAATARLSGMAVL